MTSSLPNLGTAPLANTMPSSRPPGHDIGIKEMYNISMRNNTVWGIEGYQVPREYLDSRKLAEISKKQQVKPAPRALKKPDYLTDHLRAAKDVPAPNKYDIVKPWVDEKNKPKAKHVTKKNTYIDDIIQEAKTRPTPGPGAHNLRETDEQAKKKIKTREAKGSERTNFLCEMEYLSNAIPGPGNYNPREIMPKIKQSKMNPEDWKKKHAEKRNAKSAQPDVGTYKPEPVNLTTFGKLYELHKEKKDTTKVKLWGTEKRFKFEKDAKKNPNNGPGPGQYAMTAQWNGKNAPGKKDTKDKNWMNKVTKGVTMSIYYS